MNIVIVLVEVSLRQSKIAKKVDNMTKKQQKTKEILLKKEIVRSMHLIVSSLNDETAYYDEWIHIVPDEPTEEDFFDIANDEEIFAQTISFFKSIMERYLPDGLYIANKLY